MHGEVGKAWIHRTRAVGLAVAFGVMATTAALANEAVDAMLLDVHLGNDDGFAVWEPWPTAQSCRSPARRSWSAQRG